MAFISTNPLPENLVPASLLGDPESLARTLVNTANAGNDNSLKWIRRLERYGITDAFLRDLESEVRLAQFVAYLSLDKENGVFKWTHEWPIDETLSRPSDYYAVLVAWAASSGAFRNLKKCGADDCSKYHVRRGKWCSDNCGSKYRVRKKRKLDKARGMSEQGLNL